MTATEKWNMIVKIYNTHLNESEEVVQSLWERIFAEFFGYSSFSGEIERHRNIQIGSTERVITDIIIKDGNTDLFVVELKRHNLSFSKEMEMQLLSYLKQLRINTGILVCNKIYLYDYDNSKDDNEQDIAIIEFNQDNPDGVRFVELFGKNTFNKTDIAEFVHKQKVFTENVRKIVNELNTDLVMNLVQNYFIEKYNKNEFEQAIKDINITVSPIGAAIEYPMLSKSVEETNIVRNKGHREVHKTYIINGVPCGKHEFSEYLFKQNSNGMEVNVNVIILYKDQREESKIWTVRNWKSGTSFSGNLSSGFLRGWQERGIVSIKLEV